MERQWLAVACCALAILCIGLFVFHPRVITKKEQQTAQDKEVVKEVIKEVVKEVPTVIEKEVVKEVVKEIPGPLPAFFRNEESIAQYMNTTTDKILLDHKALAIVDSFTFQAASVHKWTDRQYNKKLTDKLKESSLKFGVPVSDEARCHAYLLVSGDFNEQKTKYSYTTTLEVSTTIRILHNGTWKTLRVIVWCLKASGIIPAEGLDEAIMKIADEQASRLNSLYKMSKQK
jgi:hypothetical protein